MNITDKQTYRIIIDLQACATPASAQRGVGRLSNFWFKEIQHKSGQREVFAAVSARQPVPLGLPGNRLIRLPEMPNYSGDRDWQGGDVDTLVNLTYSNYIAQWRADIVHISHIFEAFDVPNMSLPHRSLSHSSQILSTTVYDLIPMVFPEHYFKNDNFKKFYFSRIQWLRQADLLLAISEATRNDAINLLGISPEKIAVVPLYIDSAKFQPQKLQSDSEREFLGRYNLVPHFILSVTGDEYRKNIGGLIEAYALLPEETRKQHQLVIVCAMWESRQIELKAKAEKLGISSNSLIFTGFVPDEDLSKFYSLCDLFVFPSWYEGLGLPLLEAMSCGAPVIGGDNSSIREVIGRSDALFNAHDPHAIAQAINEVLVQHNFNEDLRKYGILRAKELSGHSVGEKIIEAFDEALTRKRTVGLKYAMEGFLPQKRLACITPIPPEQSGIANYAAELLPFLAKYFDIDVYTTCANPDCPEITSGMRVYSVVDFPASAKTYDYILYEFGNSDFHSQMFDWKAGVHTPLLAAAKCNIQNRMLQSSN